MLNQPFTLPCGLTIKNRLIAAPITTFASGKSGLILEEELDYYTLRNKDVGAMIVGSAYISLSGKAYEFGVGASLDAHIPSLEKLAYTIKANGAKAILQLYHGGAFTTFYQEKNEIPCVSYEACSHLDFNDNTPYILSHSDIMRIIEVYKQSAIRAFRAGFDGIELHGNNTYLIKQFLSPSWNSRNDVWGGTRQKRYTFLEELIKQLKSAIQEQQPHRPFALGLRLSLEEGKDELEIAESISETLCAMNYFDNTGLDYFHIIQGTHLTFEASKMEQLLTELIKKTPIILCGNINQKNIKKLLSIPVVKCVAACRPLVLSPRWGKDILEDCLIHVPKLTYSEKDRQQLKLSKHLWKSFLNSKEWYEDCFKHN